MWRGNGIVSFIGIVTNDLNSRRNVSTIFSYNQALKENEMVIRKENKINI